MPLEADPESDAAAAEGAVRTDEPAAPPPAGPGRVAPTAGAVPADNAATLPPADPGRVVPPAGAIPADDPGAAPPAGLAAGQVPDGDPAAASGDGIADMGDADQVLDPASVTAARLAGAIGVAVAASSALAAVLVAAVATPLGAPAAAGLGTAVLALSAAGAAACYLWPAVRYRHIRYRLDAHGVTIRRGVVWRTVTSVPTSRVQHTDVSRGPVERYFDLATLVIHTAGTRDASVALSGLGHREAIVLRDRLIEAGGGRGG